MRAQFLPYFLKTGVQKRTVFTILSENGNLARTVFTILLKHGALARTVFTTLFMHIKLQAAASYRLCKLQAMGYKPQAAGHKLSLIHI